MPRLIEFSEAGGPEVFRLNVDVPEAGPSLSLPE